MDVLDLTAKPPAPGVTAVTPRRNIPVKWWALLGGAWLGLLGYMWTDWLVSGHAKPSPAGPTKQPGWVAASLVFWQVLFCTAALYVFYRFVIRPIRRDGRLGFDGMFLLAWITVWMIQDPWINFIQPVWTVNSHAFNLGCPQCHVPGWTSPNGWKLAESPTFILPIYLAALFTGCLLFNWVMDKARRRWPTLGNAGLVGVCFGTVFTTTFVMECVWMRMGTYTYAGSPRGFTIFAGHAYQFPATELFFWAVTWTSMSCLRYFRNDRGQTVVERGLERVQTSPRKKQSLRLLALIAATNCIMFFCSNLPQGLLFGLRAGPFPKDVLNKSYLLDGICGQWSDYACPGEHIPIPVDSKSVHVRPDGTVSVPVPIQPQNR